MNKKSLNQLTQHQSLNPTLLNASIALTHQHQGLPGKDQAIFYKKYPSINKKQQELQNSLLNSIKELGKIFQVQNKNKNNKAVLQYSVEIFEEITDLIQTHTQKYKDTNSKLIRQQQQKNQQTKRPQDIYPNIQPANFSPHLHQLTLTNIRVDCQIKQSKSLTQPCVWIDNQRDLKNLISVLSKQKEIAVDLQHSSKSYYGMTSLIQISTRETDYVIDVFPLWKQLQSLNCIFNNSGIIKVMHGAEMDVKWLQRDFNIHIVNLFDTYKASRVLGFPKFSLAYLLDHYCHVTADKSYQLADWRIRPLTPEMMHYARSDTHYLLQIWDLIRKDLTFTAQKLSQDPKSVIQDVYKSSHQVTLYETQLFTYKSIDIYQNCQYQINSQDFPIIDRIFGLIDQMAKRKNQSFYDIVSKRNLIESLVPLKDLIFNKRSKVSKITRIDKVISCLRKSKYPAIGELLTTVKNQLQRLLIKNAEIDIDQLLHSSKKSAKNKKVQKSATWKHNEKMDQQIGAQQETIVLQEYGVHFTQLPMNSFDSGLKQRQVPLEIFYRPMMTMLSKRYGLQKRLTENQDELELQQNQQEQDHNGDQDRDQEQELSGENQNQEIKFTGFRNDRNYKVEDPDVILQAQPKKKRKQQQYEEKVKNQNKNIYAYFGQE